MLESSLHLRQHIRQTALGTNGIRTVTEVSDYLMQALLTSGVR